MSVLLVLTVGHSDVQLLEGGRRFEFEKRTTGQLHGALALRNDWTIGDSKVPKGDRRPADGSGNPASLPTAPFEVCTPKLDAVLAFLADRPLAISRALILHTDRSEDPTCAGPVLQQRLTEETGVTATLVSYLSGTERLEDGDEPRDATLRRPVVHRIERAIIDALATADVTEIVLSSAGGFPVVNSLVRELVQLHAGSRTVRALEIKDASKNTGDGIDRAHERQAPTDPIAVVAAKRHALALIENGNLIAAWGAVAHLDGDPACQSWTKVLRWLYQWASSMPVDKEFDLALLTGPRRAVKAAMQVELALRADDIPRAVHSTVAFFEAALWDHLDNHLARHPTKPRVFRVTPLPASDLVRTGTDADDRKRPFEPLPEEPTDGDCWYKIHDDEVGSVKLAKHYLKAKALTHLGQAVQQVRPLRNDVAHDVPTPSVMKDARTKMQAAGLWPDDHHFLGLSINAEVLREIEISDASSLWDQLFASIRGRLLNLS